MMAKYLAYRIIEGAYTFEYIATKRPDLTNAVREELINIGREDLIS